MTVITNLRIPWVTSLPQDNNFDVSRNELVDPGNQIAVLDSAGLPATFIDWQGIDFNNVGDLNGTPIANFLTGITAESLGDLGDVDALVSSSPQNGDILYHDGVIWNRLPRGTDGQFLKSSLSTIQWGTGISQINDFSDADFRIFNDADANNIIAYDASLITSGQTRTFQLPDGDGVLARISDIPAVGSSFNDSAFNVFDDADPTKILNFQIAGITTATTRTATWPDKDGVVAMLSDIVVVGNAFDDALFRIFGNVDNTKLIAFEADTFITTATTRTITMIDEDLILLGRDNAQTVINKGIDATTNTLTNIGKTETIATFVHTDQTQLYLGQKQSFEHDATNAGIRIVPAVGTPSVQQDGDIWYDSGLAQLFGRIAGADVDLGSVTPQDSSFVIVASDEATDLDILNNPKVKFRMTMPFALNTGVGLSLGVRASVSTAPTGTADIICDIKQTGVSILTTPLHIDPGDTTSVGSATPAVILTSALTDNAEIEVEITQVGDVTPGKGLKVYLIGSS